MDLNFKAVYHYPIYDEEFGGDFLGIELFHDGEMVQWFGDYYHDKGEEKLGGFIMGIKFITGKDVNLTVERINDGRSWPY